MHGAERVKMNTYRFVRLLPAVLKIFRRLNFTNSENVY